MSAPRFRCLSCSVAHGYDFTPADFLEWQLRHDKSCPECMGPVVELDEDGRVMWTASVEPTYQPGALLRRQAG